MTNSAMIKDFAKSFLADSFWSEWEDLSDREDMLITEGERLAINRKYHDRKELSSTIAPMFADYNLNCDDFLPIQFVEEIVKTVNEHWKRPTEEFSVEQLHERYPHAAWACVAKQTGMGIAATDDQEVKDLFDILEITEPSLYRESPSAWDAVDAIQKAIIAKRSEEIHLHDSLGERLCQWHDGMDVIYAVGSYAIASIPVTPDMIRDAIARLEETLTRQKVNYPGDLEDIQELEELIEELQEVLPAEISA